MIPVSRRLWIEAGKDAVGFPFLAVKCPRRNHELRAGFRTREFVSRDPFEKGVSNESRLQTLSP